MRIALWIVQSLLAFAFLAAGFMKATVPLAELAQQMAWVESFPPFAVRFIGVAEVAGALGLILPSITRIKPVLTPIAAAALVVLMVGGAGTHLVLGEVTMMPPSIVLGSLAAFVAWGRTKAAPIPERGSVATAAA
jgi:putative oxidoreductase